MNIYLVRNEGCHMVETKKSKAHLKRKKHADTICEGKMQFRVINLHPDKDSKSSKNIEKQLFEIFKKYENQDK